MTRSMSRLSNTGDSVLASMLGVLAFSEIAEFGSSTYACHDYSDAFIADRAGWYCCMKELGKRLVYLLNETPESTSPCLTPSC
jgi:hypothetical protein